MGKVTADEARFLLAKATAGVWRYRPRALDDWGVVRSGSDGPIVAYALTHQPLDALTRNQHRANNTDPYEGNARLIEAARRLAETVIEQDAEIEQLRREVNEVRQLERSLYCELVEIRNNVRLVCNAQTSDSPALTQVYRWLAEAVNLARDQYSAAQRRLQEPNESTAAEASPSMPDERALYSANADRLARLLAPALSPQQEIGVMLGHAALFTYPPPGFEEGTPYDHCPSVTELEGRDADYMALSMLALTALEVLEARAATEYEWVEYRGITEERHTERIRVLYRGPRADGNRWVIYLCADGQTIGECGEAFFDQRTVRVKSGE